MAKKRKKDSTYGPVSILLSLILVVGVLSFLFSLFGLESYQTKISSGTLESSLITVRNFLSFDGLKFFVSNSVENLKNFEPLVLLIIVIIGLGIVEKSGLLPASVRPFRKIKFEILLFLTFFFGVISTIIGDYSYILLIPLTGVIYKYLEKNPIVGILTVFLGITIGYGTGIIFNYNDFVLGNLTQASAMLDVDKNYQFILHSRIFIQIISTFILSIIGTILINKLLVPKFPKRASLEEEELPVSHRARMYANIGLLLYALLVLYLILPLKLPGAGALLDMGQKEYIAKLFGDNAPFGRGFVLIVSAGLMLSGFLYGKISGTIKNSNEYSLGLSKNFENLGFMFVLMFFTSELVSILNWTNLGNVVGAHIVEFLGTQQFSGIPLIIIFFISVILMSILIPGTLEKWNLLYPTIIPLFMRSNITPDFTLFIFQIADGVGKAFTPLFTYFIIMLAFLEKYRTSEKQQVSIFGTLKALLPTILSFAFLWIMILVLWYLMGLPLGIGVYSTI